MSTGPSGLQGEEVPGILVHQFHPLQERLVQDLLHFVRDQGGTIRRALPEPGLGLSRDEGKCSKSQVSPASRLFSPANRATLEATLCARHM